VVKKTATKLDDQLLPLARKALKTLVVFAGVTIMLENLGYKVTSLVTGLGIGGLAFALAAKDTLSNLFGSIMIFTDKPFVIGDWVIFNGFEGIIEDIGVRSTKIRTWADTMITVPNSTVANASIENVSRFRSRRISTTLRLRIDTPPEKITQAVEYIRAHLDSREDVLKGHYIFYTDIGQYSHDIMIYYFAVSTVWRKYLDVRQSVFLDILSYFKENDIHLAVPTEIRADFDIQNI
jgi:MscS family membrane protein